MKYYIGIDLGGTNVRTLLVDENGESYSEVKGPTECQNGPDYVCDKIIKQIESLDTSVCGGLQGVEGIGIGAPGPVDTELGIMIMASNLPGFENYPICHKLKEKFGLPTFIDNDANVAGLAEAILGAGSGYKQGALNPGAVEGEISGTALTRKGKEAKGDLVKHAGDVFKLAAEGDEACQKIAEEFIDGFSTLLANVAHTVDPHCFVLGGGVFKSKAYFWDELEKRFNSKIHVGMRNHIPLLFKEIDDCGAIGAAMLPMSQLD